MKTFQDYLENVNGTINEDATDKMVDTIVSKINAKRVKRLHTGEPSMNDVIDHVDRILEGMPRKRKMSGAARSAIIQKVYRRLSD